MAKKIVWTKRASSNFNKIIEFLADKWGEKVTTNFVKRAYGIIELLSEQPTLGSLERPKENIRGFPITKHNRLFYRITGTELILLNFFDARSGKKKKF